MSKTKTNLYGGGSSFLLITGIELAMYSLTTFYFALCFWQSYFCKVKATYDAYYDGHACICSA